MPASLPRAFAAMFLLANLCLACVSQAPLAPVRPESTSAPIAVSPATVSPSPTQADSSTPAAAPKGTRAKTPRANQSKKATQAPASNEPSTAAPASSFNIILGRPTDRAITASLFAEKAAQVKLDVRKSDGSGEAQSFSASLTAGVPQNIEIGGLAPDTAYTYTASLDGASPLSHNFHTQRAPGSPFVFTLDADPHHTDPNFNSSLYAVTLNNALQDRPDFHIDLGDTFMTEKVQAQTAAEVASTLRDVRPFFGLLAADAPLFLVNGNHEGELGWLLQTGAPTPPLPLLSTRLRQQFYPNPYPNGFYTGAVSPDPFLSADGLSPLRDGFYAWTWGDALFIVLDPFWYTTSRPQPDNADSRWSWTLGKAQYDWLKSTLESSPALYKFVFIHHLLGGSDKDARGGVEAAPYFEWGGKNADGSYGFDQQRPGWGMPIHQLLVQNQVSAVFHGHDHVYVRQELDGIVYQEVPQPSMAQYNNTRPAADYGYLSGSVFGSSGHLRVSVSPQGAKVEYIRAYLATDSKPGQQNAQVDAVYTISPP